MKQLDSITSAILSSRRRTQRSGTNCDRLHCESLETRVMLTKVPVTVVIPELVQIDSPDVFPGDNGDYYAVVRIGSEPPQSSRDKVVSGSHVSPGWSFTAYVDESADNVPVQISIFDRDSILPGDEDPIDVDATPGDYTLDLLFNLTTGEWSGDVNSPGKSATGDGDSYRATLQFDVYRSIPVTFAISDLLQVDNPDGSSGDGDYYAVVAFNNYRTLSSLNELVSGAEVTAAWTFTEYVRESDKTVDLQISLFDRDAVSTDDVIDISPVAGKNTLDLAFDLQTGMWTGDVDSPVFSAEGNGDSPSSVMFFNITTSRFVWINKFNDGYDNLYEENADIARNLSEYAMSMWETVIQDFHHIGLPNIFGVQFVAGSLSDYGVTQVTKRDAEGKPFHARITMDYDGNASRGWYFDSSPQDDLEFDSIINGYAATANSGILVNQPDYLTVLLHELGHAMGIGRESLVPFLTPTGHTGLSIFTPTGTTITFEGGGHIYGGRADIDGDGIEDVTTLPHELMNHGITLDERTLISPIDIEILQTAFGYDVIPVDSLRNMTAQLDPATGRLIVRGINRGEEDDDFQISLADGALIIRSNETVTKFPQTLITSIDVIGGIGNDTLTIDFTGGNPIPADGINFNGGGGEADTLTVVGATHTDYLPDSDQNLGDGELLISDSSIRLTGLEVVRRFAPLIGPIHLDETVLEEGEAVTINGEFADPGSSSTHTIFYDWGDGTVEGPFTLAIGQRTFTRSHVYQDDLPENTSADHFSVQVTIIDDENVSGIAFAPPLTVRNVAPKIDSIAVDTTKINEGDPPVVVSGTFSDPGQHAYGTQGVGVGLNPNDFAPLGVFDPHSDVNINTSTLQMTDGMAAEGTLVTVPGPNGPIEIAVFTFDSVRLESGITLRGTGSRPLALLSQGSIYIAGTIDVSASGVIPGAGGGRGGDSPNSYDGGIADGAPESGTGKTGVSGNSPGGGGGGAFGGDGGLGLLIGSPGGEGGNAYGDLTIAIQGGSGGGAGRTPTGELSSTGGAGGGGLELGAVNSLEIAPSGSLLAIGGDAGTPLIFTASGGGGAGGGLLLHGFDVIVAGTLNVDGGNARTAQQGGGGGGGRILIAHNNAGSLTNNGTLSLNGGASSSRFSIPGDSGSLGIVSSPGADRGSSESFTGTVIWSDGVETALVIDAVNGTFTTSRCFVDDDPSSGTAADVFTVAISIHDDDLGSDAMISPVITVHNVAPVIDTILSSAGTLDDPTASGELLTLTGLFSDPGLLDLHTVIVDWGESVFPGDAADTSDSSNPLDTSVDVTSMGDGSGSFIATHVYDSGGIYTITVTVIDDDTGTVVNNSTTVYVSGVRVDPNTATLQIVGTSAADQVTINGRRNGQLNVYADFLQNGDLRVIDPAATLFDRIVVYLADGNDVLLVSNNVEITAVVHGGDGDDRITAGGGPSVLLGESGNDTLIGRNFSILIGGNGMDLLRGGSGSDLLIGGNTNAVDDQSLFKMLSIWSKGSYADQAAAIQEFLTVADDNEADEIRGGPDLDLFYMGFSDDLLDLKMDEIVRFPAN